VPVTAEIKLLGIKLKNVGIYLFLGIIKED
jgi:hypothetical protein